MDGGVEAVEAQTTASYLSADIARLTLASATAQAYLLLRSIDAQLVATRTALTVRTESLALIRRRAAGGLVSDLDVAQAEGARADSEAQLIECLRSLDVARQVFLFDMELVEPVPGEMAARFRSLDHAITIAARVSDRNEPPSRAIGNRAADTIWLDEFKGPWATRDTVAELIQAGRKVYAVSPELHGMKLEQAITRWHDFALWGVTGICTDLPLLLARELESIDRRGISTGRNNGSQTP